MKQECSFDQAIKIIQEYSKPKEDLRKKIAEHFSNFKIVWQTADPDKNYKILPLFKYVFEFKKDMQKNWGDDLKNKTPPQWLLDEFEKGRNPLSGNSTLREIDRDRKWEILDGEKGYLLKKEGEWWMSYIRFPFKNLFDQDASLMKIAYCILGDPRSGKSSLFGHICRKMATRELPVQGRQLLPVFISLSDWMKSEKYGLADYLAEIKGEPYNGIEKTQWDLWIRENSLCLFLDGLDELKGKTDAFWKNSLEPLFKKNESKNILEPRYHLIFSCRTIPYYGAYKTQMCHIPVFELGEFDPGLREQFITDFPASYPGNYDAPGLIKKIGETPSIETLSRNPLLLSLVCLLMDQKDSEKKISLPATTTEFYERVMEMMLFKRDQPGMRKVEIDWPSSITWEEKLELLEEIAWKLWIQEKDAIFYGEGEIKKIMEPILKRSDRYGQEINKWLDSFLIDFHHNSGILQKEASSSRCYFPHRTFLEFLSASHLIRRLSLEKEKKGGWEMGEVVNKEGKEQKIFTLLQEKQCDSRLQEKQYDSRWSVVMGFLSESQGRFKDRVEEMERPLEFGGAYIRFFFLFWKRIQKALGRKYHRNILPAGFQYLGKKTYSCGGQTHTVHEYKHEKTGLEFVLIPSGTFLMGSNEWEDSQPIHVVRIGKPFLMSKTAVTQRVWKKVMGEENNPSYFKGDDLPMENITWNKAEEFCKKAGLFLPSEAQWEYACRAGTGSKWYFGNDKSKLGDYAWYDENSGYQTHPVGEKKKGHNAFGLYDMMGNVWEWCMDACADWYKIEDFNYNNVPCDGSAYIDSGSNRVYRGGSFYYDAGLCASGRRSDDGPGYRGDDLGLRVGLSLC